MTTGKTIALAECAIVRNMISLLPVYVLDDCSHEIKTCFLLGKRVMRNPDSCQFSKWCIRRTGNLGVPQSMGSQEVRHE